LVSPFLSQVEDRSFFYCQAFLDGNEQKPAPPPTDSWLKYIHFVKIGQPKLSERKNQRNGLFVLPTSLHPEATLKVNDYG
jgi:hypothetical protein